jgi:hypothetical protein
MGCCGKIKKGIKLTSQIVEGHVKLAGKNLLHHQNEKYPEWNKRVLICQSCDKQTWFNTKIPNILKELPKQDPSTTNIHLFCMECRCYIPAKAFVKDAECPLKKW